LERIARSVKSIVAKVVRGEGGPPHPPPPEPIRNFKAEVDDDGRANSFDEFAVKTNRDASSPRVSRYLRRHLSVASEQKYALHSENFSAEKKSLCVTNFLCNAKNFSSDTPNRVRYANAERVARMSLAVDIAFDSRHVRKSFQSSDSVDDLTDMSTTSRTRCIALIAMRSTVRRQPRSVHSRVSRHMRVTNFRTRVRLHMRKIFVYRKFSTRSYPRVTDRRV
jgi:hypothetical protein